MYVKIKPTFRLVKIMPALKSIKKAKHFWTALRP